MKGLVYVTLVDKIAQLHTPLSRLAPPLAVPADWIPTVVDTTTSEFPGKLPVVVAFGANYATGQGKMPTRLSAVARRASSPPWVEDNLKRWRNVAKQHIDACAHGNVVAHWNGLLPHDTLQPIVARQCSDLTDAGYHFIMANVCPWITLRNWATIRDDQFEDVSGLISRFDHPLGLNGYFRRLKRLLGPDSIWVGHGNADIYGIFRYVCWTLDIQRWFFTSNLSFRNVMMCSSTTKP